MRLFHQVLGAMALSFVMALPAHAQFTVYGPANALTISTVALPSTCTIGQLYIRTATSIAISLCSATDTWTALSTGGGLPSGFIGMVASGTCPTGTSEVSALSGKTLIGTVAANGDVGSTGGSDTITPTVASLTAAAQTFTGSSANTSAVSAGTPTGTNGTGTVTPLGTIAWPAGVPTFTGTPGTTGAASAGAQKIGTTTSTVTLATHTHTFTPAGTVAWPAGVPTLSGSSSVTSAEVFTGSALGTHLHTLTATGTNGTSAVTGTLTAFDNRSAYTKVIFCSAN